MEHMHNEELSDVARLVEVTSDAVAICDADGAVRHVNRQFLVLQKMSRSQVSAPTSKTCSTVRDLSEPPVTRCLFRPMAKRAR